MSLISRRASYGLRTVYRLANRAREGKGATIAALAEKEHLPRKYLEQVVRDLKQAGLVDSRSGPGGGCRLAKPASEMTVGDVVRALDGEIRPGHCLEGHVGREADDCPGCWGFTTCAMREIWVKLQGAIDGVLDGTTIADMVTRQEQLQGVAVGTYQI